MKETIKYYLILGALFISTIFAWIIWSPIDWVSTYMPNISAELFGIILTLLVVEKLLKAEKSIETKKVTLLACKKLKLPIERICILFASMIKSSIDPKSATKALPNTFIDLFHSDHLLNYLKSFDFQAKAPVEPKESWLQHSHKSLMDNLSKISTVLEKYVAYLDVEFLEIFEDLETNHLITFSKDAYQMPTISAQYGHGLDGRLFKDNTLIFKQNIGGLVKAIDKLSEFGVLVTLPEDFWSQNKNPKIGDSRNI